jgi:DNA-binding NarL/FixJ family response regulator
MEPLVRANLLAVGLAGKTQLFGDLPIRLISVDSAAEAVRCIRDDKFKGVISRWQLCDMSDGLFLRKLRMVKPDVATIVLVHGDDPSEEILARSIGVSAVLTEQCSDNLLLQTVSELLGLEVHVGVPAVTEVKQSTERRGNYGRVIS